MSDESGAMQNSETFEQWCRRVHQGEIVRLSAEIERLRARQTCEGDKPYVCHALATARAELCDKWNKQIVRSARDAAEIDRMRARLAEANPVFAGEGFAPRGCSDTTGPAGVYYAPACTTGSQNDTSCLDPTLASECSFGSADECVPCPNGCLCPGGSRCW